jgi:hypothetical protein
MAWQDLTTQITIDKLMNSAKAANEAKIVKDYAAKKKYVYALSLYGVLTDRSSGRSEYRRIEVLSNVFWTGEIVELIYRFFQKIKPAKTYSIWLYDKQRRALGLAGAWD